MVLVLRPGLHSLSCGGGGGPAGTRDDPGLLQAPRFLVAKTHPRCPQHGAERHSWRGPRAPCSLGPEGEGGEGLWVPRDEGRGSPRGSRVSLECRAGLLGGQDAPAEPFHSGGSAMEQVPITGCTGPRGRWRATRRVLPGSRDEPLLRVLGRVLCRSAPACPDVMTRTRGPKAWQGVPLPRVTPVCSGPSS